MKRRCGVVVAGFLLSATLLSPQALWAKPTVQVTKLPLEPKATAYFYSQDKIRLYVLHTKPGQLDTLAEYDVVHAALQRKQAIDGDFGAPAVLTPDDQWLIGRYQRMGWGRMEEGLAFYDTQTLTRQKLLILRGLVDQLPREEAEWAETPVHVTAAIDREGREKGTL